MVEKSFGQAISEERKKKGWSQKELASRILREDGGAISPQYLNDIEHDRRSPTSDHLVVQFANVLGLDADWLYVRAGRLPADIDRSVGQAEAVEAMRAFRKSLRKGGS